MKVNINRQVSKFDPPGHETGFCRGLVVVQCVFAREGCGKDFWVETIILIEPNSKLHGFVNDLLVFLLRHGQDDGTFISLGWLPCRSGGHNYP